MGHTHGASASGRNRHRLTFVLILTGGYLVAEIVGGLLTGSLALLADAGHMLTDVGGLAIALFAIRLAERPATPAQTYGYYRGEILGAAMNATLLVGVSAYVLYEAYERFRNPTPVSSGPMLAVAAVGLGVNLVGIVLLRKASSESLNMKGAYFEVVSDLLSSVAVLVAAVAIRFTGWSRIDPILSAGIGLFILPRTWILLRDAVGILLEGTPTDINIGAVRESLAAVPGVTGVHDLHIWCLTSGVNALSAHVVLGPESDPGYILRAVRGRAMQDFRIAHVTVQVEPPGFEEEETHF